jgi:two-component system sensor histidine kinase RpfC
VVPAPRSTAAAPAVHRVGYRHRHPGRRRERLFEAFEQADGSLSRRHGGTGLGTTIAKGLTEAMGGTIGFESASSIGSRFWVELPFELQARGCGRRCTGAWHRWKPRASPGRGRQRHRLLRSVPAPSRPRAQPADPGRRRPCEANRMVLQRLLQKAGHRVTCVNGGEEVLDALEVGDYDAVVDLHMPGISGLDLLKQLRVMEAGGQARTPVVVLSADVTPESIQRASRQAHAPSSPSRSSPRSCWTGSPRSPLQRQGSIGTPVDIRQA